MPVGVRSVGVYGADVMLASDGTPYLLELSFAPDNSTIAKQHPSFWNDLFAAVFLGESSNVVWL